MAEKSSLVKIVSEKLIKPSSPTSPSSRYYKVNAFDANLGHWLINVALFYPKRSFHGGKSSSTKEELFEVLETSLSKTLTYYYPFAGRLMDDNITIDCNDAGLQLWEVEQQGSMSKMLDNSANYTPWNFVFHHEMYSCVQSLVAVQLRYFECGGICAVVSFSHKLGDGTTIVNFINDWAMIARGSEDVGPQRPMFSGASIFPPPKGPIGPTSFDETLISTDLVTQRFVFSISSISKLKIQVIKETEIKDPTQVEVVTAFIFERLNSFGKFKPSSLMQMVNFRPITIPPLSDQIVGNFIDKFVIAVTEEKEMTFSKIVSELRKRKVEYKNTCSARLEGNEFMNRVTKFSIEDEKKLNVNNFDMYVFTSWFRFPFYEADFGFGKPIFVCQPVGVLDRTTVLMANPSGNGIDALITLKRDQMPIFEQDKQVLVFASINPSICTPNKINFLSED